MEILTVIAGLFIYDGVYFLLKRMRDFFISRDTSF